MSTIYPPPSPSPAAHPDRLSDVVAAERTAGQLTTAGQVALCAPCGSSPARPSSWS